MDATILNVAYDDIVSSLGATLDEVSWASTAYILASVSILPLTGWLVARFGRKRMYILILALFGLGSLLCGFATTATQLGVFRVLQGMGGGLLAAVSQSVLFDAYPAEERKDAINLLSVLSMVGPVMGPIVAGLVLERFSWPMLFFLNVPLAVFTIWLAMGMDIDQKAKSVPGRFSFTTIGLLFATLFSLQYVLQSGDRLDWFDSAEIRWSMLAALVFGGLLIAQQLRTKLPMIDLRLFSNREFLIGNLMSFIGGASNYAVAFIGPLFLQQVLGFSPFQTGLLTIPATIGLLIGNRLQDYLSRRYSVYAVVSGGMLVLALALWYNGVYSDLNDFNSITWLRVIQGIAFGVFIVPIGVFAFRSIKQNQIDAASGLFAVVRQESGMIGIALIATLLESSQSRYVQRLLLDVPRWPTLLHRGAPSREQVVAAINQHAFVLSYQHVFAVSAGIMCAAGVLIALYGLWGRLGYTLGNKTAGDIA